MHDFYSWGLPVGTVAGIRIRLHWTLLVFWFFVLGEYGGLRLSGLEVLGLWAAHVGLGFLTILLHEFGHCFAARAVGGDAREILLWPLGGLAMCGAPNLWRSQFIVAAGGPLVTLAILATSFGLFRWLDVAAPEWASSGMVWTLSYVLVDWQLFLLIFNCIPLYPLDGGRMFHACLWGFLGRKGSAPGAYGRATLATVWASRACAVAGVLYGLYEKSIWMVIIFLWAWSGAESLRRSLARGAGEDYVFGYDFSRGYSSLETTTAPGERRPRRRWPRLFRKRRRPAPKEAAPTGRDRERVDELLAKISESGMGSLTDEERRFLEGVSHRWRRND